MISVNLLRGTAGLPRRGFAPPRNDNTGAWGGGFACLALPCHCEEGIEEN
ncbi:MAG: hypothetical protein O3A82_09725 [Verrucomicrobia bacterium]|nr:hypothetical protein [Verrucomicrobiota bacterium]